MFTERSKCCAESAGQTIEHAVLEADAIQQLRSELKEFTLATLHRLRSLSQSVQQYEQTQHRLPRQDCQPVEQDNPACQTPVNYEPASLIDRDRDHRTETSNEATQEHPACAEEADPMQRLSAIKQRLQQQMQSTR